METSTWSLRLALLLLGSLIVLGIYLWTGWRRRREANRRYGRRLSEPGWNRSSHDGTEDDTAEGQAPPEDDFEIIVLPPREHVGELPAVRNEREAPRTTPTAAKPASEAQVVIPANLREEPAAPAQAVPEPPMEHDREPVARSARHSRRRKVDQLSFGFDDETGRQGTPARQPPNPEVLALYLRPQAQPHFEGPALERALAAVGLKFGEMGIYHHFGAGELRAETPLFSLANMFEPGHFEPEKMAEFTTAGLALFIQFPAPLDGPVAFELFLNAAQRLADTLQAELLGEPRKPLDAITIDRMRRIAARYAGDR